MKKENKNIIETILLGITNLVEGQLQFSQEFGLADERVLPKQAKFLSGKSVKKTLSKWLDDKDNGAEYFDQLLKSLVDHQLALISGLDGICVQALNMVEDKHIEKKSLLTKLSGVLAREKESERSLIELKSNTQLRYQQVLAPGFINAYMKSREK